MAATKYPPIQEVHRNGTVPQVKIREAVDKLARLRRSNPAKYKEMIRSGSNRDIRLVMKHAHA
jgi:hypothetical protein